MMKKKIEGIVTPGNQEPRVGIFWLLGDGTLLLDATPLAEAEPYGEFLTHSRSHIDQWAEFQRHAIAPRDAEYEEWPRGRVVYDARQKRFTLYADRCILIRKNVIRKIMTAMNLTKNQTELSPDEHYRCSTCLIH
jgi:hypothetical protein